jgi:small multidrug resistance pump
MGIPKGRDRLRRNNMAWTLLILAILLEVCGTTCLKLSRGFTEIVPSVLMFVFYGACFTTFAFAVRKIEVSTAYAIWCGCGVAFIGIIGCVFFKESASAMKIIGLLLVVLGVAALKISDRTAQ